VNAPRFRIAWMMAIVALVALDCAAIRELVALKVRSTVRVYITCDSLMAGALPMANILAVGLLVGLGRWRGRPFLVGFEVTGTLALVVCVSLAVLFQEEVIAPYVDLAAEPIFRALRPGWRSPAPLFYSIVSVMLLTPQVAVALFGGWLTRRLTIANARVSARPGGLR
jgi:hypothetical protein